MKNIMLAFWLLGLAYLPIFYGQKIRIACQKIRIAWVLTGFSQNFHEISRKVNVYDVDSELYVLFDPNQSLETVATELSFRSLLLRDSAKSDCDHSDSSNAIPASKSRCRFQSAHLAFASSLVSLEYDLVVFVDDSQFASVIGTLDYRYFRSASLIYVVDSLSSDDAMVIFPKPFITTTYLSVLNFSYIVTPKEHVLQAVVQKAHELNMTNCINTLDCSLPNNNSSSNKELNIPSSCKSSSLSSGGDSDNRRHRQLLTTVANNKVDNNTTAPHSNLRRHSNIKANAHVSCPVLIRHINNRRLTCMQQSTTQIEIMTFFAADYHHLMPFLLHYLALGVTRILVYNNDFNTDGSNKVEWYMHPAILCLLRHQLIELQPWPGEGVLMKGLEHWLDLAKGRYAPNTNPNIWISFLDIDELLVLHTDNCLNSFLDHYPKAPEIAFNWAMFVPEFPLDDFATSGNIASLSPDHLAILRQYSNHHHSPEHPMIILPHDMLLRRQRENEHVKSITRLVCADKIYNQHFTKLTASCPYGTSSHDPQNHTIPTAYNTPWVDDNYPVAQLNHYWTLSLRDYLRKSHRGNGGVYSRNADQFRSTREFVSAGTKRAFVNDTSFLKRYGPWFNDLKVSCPACFDNALYHHRQQQQMQ